MKINKETATMSELIAYYNFMTHQGIKSFPNRETALKKIEEQETLYSSNPVKYDWPVESYYSPKQAEEILGLKPTIIRKKLRKLFPDHSGPWKITKEMIEKCK